MPKGMNGAKLTGSVPTIEGPGSILQLQEPAADQLRAGGLFLTRGASQVVEVDAPFCVGDDVKPLPLPQRSVIGPLGIYSGSGSFTSSFEPFSSSFELALSKGYISPTDSLFVFCVNGVLILIGELTIEAF